MITVKIATVRGHDLMTFETPAEARKFTLDTAKTTDKWLFINGEVHNNIAGVSVDMFNDTAEIVLANRIVGGE